jgi:hypothetical protein
VVSQWSEITAENLGEWQRRYAPVLSAAGFRERLTNRYWIERARREGARRLGA